MSTSTLLALVPARTAFPTHVTAQADTVTDKIPMPSMDWIAIGPITILIGGALLLLLVRSIARPRVRMTGGLIAAMIVAGGASLGAFAWAIHAWLDDPGKAGFSNPELVVVITGAVVGLVAVGIALAGSYSLYSVLTAATAAVACIPLWHRVRFGGSSSVVSNALKVDGFGVFLTLLICASIALAALIADDYLRREGLEGPEFSVLMLLSGSGAVMMAEANDLIVLFLGLEVLSIALYILAGSHLRRAESQEAAIKYFVLGSFSSAVFLYGVALVYGATGTTNLPEIAAYLSRNVAISNGLLTTGLVLLLMGLGFKVAAVPFHMWTPDVYQGSPTPATAFMAAAAKVGGFAGLLRVLLTALQTQRLDWQPVIWVFAVLSIVVGSVLAVVQTDIKRMLAYSSISHAGYILIGIQAANRDGVSGALFYLLAYTFIVIGSFAVITVVGRRGDADHSLDSYRGLSQRRPLLAFVFMVLLLAQAGVPLTSGFVAKFGVILAAVKAHSYALAIIAMLAAVIAAFFYLRIIVLMYMTPADAGDAPAGALRVPAGVAVVLTTALALTLFAGILPQYLLDFARAATLR